LSAQVPSGHFTAVAAHVVEHFRRSLTHCPALHLTGDSGGHGQFARSFTQLLSQHTNCVELHFSLSHALCEATHARFEQRMGASTGHGQASLEATHVPSVHLTWPSLHAV